ncbi:HAD-IA family hydrolase [Actinotalea fermentans]|uniref:Haloacid dehalogenase n=1 Tax=Actinotalea fermentans TaxID=43671 RepID=A0A511YUK8_9CELL|nr:HAD-IA family hydrolase [Actinotalea fermentans]GEN78880.1 haloacid dehalogenase [Actinotalea fermentans]
MSGVPAAAQGRPAAARRIDAVLFDLGNVLVRWDPYLPYEGHVPRQVVEEFFRESDFMALNHAQDAGEPWPVLRAQLAAERPDLVPMLDIYLADHRLSVPGEVPGAEATVRHLRAVGVRVFGLTNWGAENWHVAAEQAPVVGLLEGVVVSGHEKVAKPDPEVFRRAVARFRLDPARTLFTDDTPRNVEAAGRAGFRTHLFRGHAELGEELTALGIPRVGTGGDLA